MTVMQPSRNLPGRVTRTVGEPARSTELRRGNVAAEPVLRNFRDAYPERDERRRGTADGKTGLIRAAILHVLRKINVGPDGPPNLDLLADRRRTGCARARTRQVATHQLLGGTDEARIVGRRRGHERFRGPVGRTCVCHPASVRIASRNLCERSERGIRPIPAGRLPTAPTGVPITGADTGAPITRRGGSTVAPIGAPTGGPRTTRAPITGTRTRVPITDRTRIGVPTMGVLRGGYYRRAHYRPVARPCARAYYRRR